MLFNHLKIHNKEGIFIHREDMKAFILLLLILTGINGNITMTFSAQIATLGESFNISCTVSVGEILSTFFVNTIPLCVISGVNASGCIFSGTCNRSYNYHCQQNLYTVMIPGTSMTEGLHGSEWKCQGFSVDTTPEKKTLHVNIPVSSATILSTPTDTDPVQVIVGQQQTFRCTTSPARPSSRIQWYLLSADLTTSAQPQPDICNPGCNAKVISSSILVYTGDEIDNNKSMYCTASNIDGRSVRSENKVITILYGPSSVVIIPSTPSYTVTETTYSVGPISCTADCRPDCTYQWTGPNGLVSTTSILNLQNIDRNQAGDYSCTASNSVGSLMSGVVTVIVNYGPRDVVLVPLNAEYILNESNTLGPITCSSDCNPNCSFTWTGANIPGGTTNVLMIQNIHRNDGGIYKCTASNRKGSLESKKINVIVHYGPSSVVFSPLTSSYTVVETTDSVGPIKCTADCEPDCTYQWSGLNGPVSTTSELNLPNIDRNQAGDYSCTASNSVGSSVSGTITIVVNYGPGNVNLSPTTLSYNIDKGQRLGPITCSADCNPGCTLTWKGPGLSDIVSPILNIQNIERSEAGNYNCTARNSLRTATSSNITVTVSYGPEQVSISPSTPSYTVTETTESVGPIRCIADCRPNCTYQWTGPNGPVSAISELNLQKIDRNQAGNYHCTAQNRLGTHTSIIIGVDVHYGPRTVNLMPHTTSYTVKETEDNIGPINCTADCKPACSLTWTGPNIPGGTTSVLDISNIDRSQAGNYICTAANNIKTETSAIVQIVVHYGPGNVVITPNMNITVNETENIGPISCSADCKPECNMIWNGPNLPTGTTSTLTVQNINKNQTGQYKCTAMYNNIGDVSSNIQVIVNYLPLLNNVFGSTDYNENDRLDLSCSAKSVPLATFRWKFDGTIINSSYINSSLSTSPPTTTSFLRIPNIQCLSMGKYSCEANNMLGEVEKTVNVVVQCSPRPLYVDQNTIQNITVKENEKLNITVLIIAYPEPGFTWSFLQNEDNYMDIYEGKEKVSSENQHFISLVVPNITDQSFGVYRLTATNINGKTEIEYNVTSARRPDPPNNITCEPRPSSLHVYWKSNSDGGSPQTFKVHYRQLTEVEFRRSESNNSDPGKYSYTSEEIFNLKSETAYKMLIQACNIYNCSLSDEITCNTSMKVNQEGSNLAVIGVGAGLGSAVVIIGIVVVVLVILRRFKSKKGDEKKPIKSRMEHKEVDEDSDDGLKLNPIYGQPVGRTDHQPKNQGGSSDVYASVVKPDKKQNKKGKRQKNKDAKSLERGCVYENHEDFKVDQDDQIYENENSTMTQNSQVGQTKGRKNNELIYAELDLAPVPSERRFIIRGLENKTDYADIDLNLKAEPLPSSDEDEEKEENKNPIK